tara:strand:- start:658 stop:1302 length:645 start_codon:yes stop_codon:yes gene_type:complete
MQKTVILVLSVLVLSLFTNKALAKTQMVDVIHLTDGSVVVGKIIENIPDESIKIETKEKSWTKDQSISIIKMSDVDKIKKIQFVEPISPGFAAGLGCGTIYLNFTLLPVIPISGVGQIYNGQPLKGLAFFGIGILGSYLIKFGSDNAEWTFDDRIGELGVTLVLGSMLLSPIDAYYSAKKINSEAKKKLLSTTTSLNLNYIPHQGMMASYGLRF